MGWTYDYSLRGYGSEEMTLSAPALQVGVDQFGIIRSRGNRQLVYTMDVDVCAGVAVFNDNGPGVAGVMHILSDPAFYSRGEKAVQEHAQRSWNMLSQNLDPHTSFSAILFGGRKEVPGHDGPGIKVSGWLAEGLRRAVENKANIAVVRNFQGEGGPHDAILDLGLKCVYMQSATAKPIIIQTPKELVYSGVPIQKFTF